MANNRKKRRRNFRLCIVVAAGLLLAAAAIWLVFSLVRWLGGGSAESRPSPGSSEAAAPAKTSGITTEASAASPASSESTAVKTTVRHTAGHYVQKNRSPWNLLLVNDWNPVPDQYLSAVTIADFNGPSKQCDSRIIEPLRNMLNDGNAYNASFRLSAASLYRTEELQARNYNRQVTYYKNQGYDQETAESKAATVVKRPGESEHNTGLCVDLLGAGYSSLEQSFANTEAYTWLRAHCADYGFILRYPKEKEAVTAVIFEPWHYRYVGVETAKEIMSRGLCLEEYVEEKGM